MVEWGEVALIQAYSGLTFLSPLGDFLQDGCCFPGKCHLTKQRIGAADDALAATGIYSLFTAQVHVFRRISVGGYIDKFTFMGIEGKGNIRFFAQCSTAFLVPVEARAFRNSR